jgi:hypothetical protein
METTSSAGLVLLICGCFALGFVAGIWAAVLIVREEK